MQVAAPCCVLAVSEGQSAGSLSQREGPAFP